MKDIQIFIKTFCCFNIFLFSILSLLALLFISVCFLCYTAKLRVKTENSSDFGFLECHLGDQYICGTKPFQLHNCE